MPVQPAVERKNMDKKDILSRVDHTLLSQTATWEEIRQILDDGIKYGCASACIPACYVKQAAEYVEGKLPICFLAIRDDNPLMRSTTIRRTTAVAYASFV